MFVISFLVYFDKKVHQKTEKKKISKQKNFKPWILLNQTRTEKQMRAAALRHMIYFFSLTTNLLSILQTDMVANTQCGYKVRNGDPTRHDVDHLIFVRGCTDAMKVWAEDNLTTMAAVALGLAIPQVK